MAGKRNCYIPFWTCSVGDVVAQPRENGQQAVRGSGQELRRKVWAADTDPKFITRQKPWERKGPPGPEDRLRRNPKENQHFRMKEVKEDNEGEAKESWSQRMVLEKKMEPQRSQV